MKTLYIDVFFLVNFTITLLSAFFSACFVHLRTNSKRLIALGTLGGVSAILDLFFGESLFAKLFLSLVFLSLCMLLITHGASVVRRTRFILLFLLFQLLIGGIVEFSYSFLDKIVKISVDEIAVSAENRRLLVFSMILLLTIGVFKLFIMLFSSSPTEKSVRIGIKIGGVTVEEEALVDTGNLVKDPMNMCPVLFVKEDFARTFLPKNLIELTDVDALDRSFKKRIRLIPVTKDGSTHVITGVRVDEVGVIKDGKIEPCEMTVAIDKEGGSFGGFMALAPGLVSEYAYKTDKRDKG